jgi:hypothetical protein
MTSPTSWITRKTNALQSLAKRTHTRETVAPVLPPLDFRRTRDQDARARQQEDTWDSEGGATPTEGEATS